MDKKSKILAFVLTLFLCISIGAKYYKFAVAEDFYISMELECDTQTESCFVWDCDIESDECDQTPYKYIWKHAANVPHCQPLEEECEELVCETDEDSCEIIYCSEDTLGEEEFCYNPNE